MCDNNLSLWLHCGNCFLNIKALGTNIRWFSCTLRQLQQERCPLCGTSNHLIIVGGLEIDKILSHRTSETQSPERPAQITERPAPGQTSQATVQTQIFSGMGRGRSNYRQPSFLPASHEQQREYFSNDK